MSGQLLQAEPRGRDAVARAVFDHLIQVEIRDPSAINHLRQEVHSGGFDVYLRYSGWQHASTRTGGFDVARS